MRVWLAVVAVTGCSSPHPQQPVAEADPPMCSGQTADSRATTQTPRDGAMMLQLSPGFLDQMPPCSGQNAVPDHELVVAGEGRVNAKGDCEWSNGVTCHFHLGAEYVDSRAPRPQVGELHCIFPTSEPNHPQVYGTHFTCQPGTEVPRARDVRQEQPCGANLLLTIAATMAGCDARCCDRGTLTDPADERRKAGELDVRPDFSVCTATAELDCSMFATMTGRAAYAPRFGPPAETAF